MHSISLLRKVSRPLASKFFRRIQNGQRHYYHELSHLEPGDPSKVLQYHSDGQEPNHNSGSEDSDFLKVQMLHAPWNPADQNSIQGRYPSPLKKPMAQWPSIQGTEWKVAGSEGWGRIEESNDPEMPVGTYVTMGQSGMGTFRSSLWVPKLSVIPISIEQGNQLKETVGPAVSSLFQLGGTALRMLSDFETLSEENSVVVQNAGNSGVGWMVSQLAAQQNIPVISLVRRGSRSDDEFQQLVDELTQKSTNTTQVVAEEDLLSDKETLKKLQSQFRNQPPRLALNAVGGDSATLLLKLIAPGGTVVTYGGMSMKPVTVATPQLIFKDVKVRGYWHSRWMVRSFSKERKQMIDHLVKSVLDGKVQCPPVKVFPLSELQNALEFESGQSSNATTRIRRKVVFDCGET